MVRVRLGHWMEQKKWEREQKVTYKEIASATGISVPTLARLASARGHNAGLDVVEKLCRYFEVGPSELLELVPPLANADQAST